MIVLEQHLVPCFPFAHQQDRVVYSPPQKKLFAWHLPDHEICHHWHVLFGLKNYFVWFIKDSCYKVTRWIFQIFLKLGWRPPSFLYFQNFGAETIFSQRTFKYNMTVFLSSFRPPPPCDGILTFSANLSPHMTFSTSPSSHIHRK